MANLNEIEKLHGMMKKGIISEAEFEAQKTKLLQQGNENKNQLVYCVLAFFLGTFGVHNFYAGRWKRGLTQLLLTLLTLFIGTVITYLWAVINIFTIHTDGKGNEFEPSRAGKYTFGILGILGYLWTLLQVFALISGIILGYTTAMRGYQLKELAYQISALSRVSNGGTGIMSMRECDSLGMPLPEFFTGRCVVYPEGKVIFSGLDEEVKKFLTKKRIAEMDISGNIIFSF